MQSDCPPVTTHKQKLCVHEMLDEEDLSNQSRMIKRVEAMVTWKILVK